MKKIIMLTLASTLIFACNNNSDIAPTDLNGMKALLKEKNADLISLETEIASLKSEINKLEPAVESDPVPVSTIDISKKNFQRKTMIQASAVSDDIVNASSETGGRIVRLYVKENDHVRRGQLVAKIDLETVERQISEIETSLDLAKTVFDRQKRLWDQNIGSEIQYLESKNNKERIEKSLETLKTQLKKSNIYSPISGVVDREFLKAGEMSSPGMPIIQILNTSNIKFVADVPENYLSSIELGNEVEIYLPALDIEMKEKVSMIGRSIDPANRTFKIEIAVPNKKGMLKPNLLAEVRFVDFEIDEVVSIPVNLVQQEVSGDRYVFIVEKSDTASRAKKMMVETSESNGSNIIISSGLVGTETLINEGYRSVTEGRKVVVQNIQNEEDAK